VPAAKFPIRGPHLLQPFWLHVDDWHEALHEQGRLVMQLKRARHPQQALQQAGRQRVAGLPESDIEVLLGLGLARFAEGGTVRLDLIQQVVHVFLLYRPHLEASTILSNAERTGADIPNLAVV
jgi:hypothetical protein